MPSDVIDSEYPFRSLDELMDIQGGAQPPASTFKDAPEPGYVRFVQIRDFETDAHKTYIRREDKWRYCDQRDVLIARYGASVGRICRGLSGAYNVALVKVIPKDAEIGFLYHLLRSRYFQEPLASMSARSAQAGFNKTDLSAIRVPVPPREKQGEISEILDSFDNRIDLLKKTNRSLEGISSSLFKSWFINFDPVRAKSEGREPEGMSADIAALFPSEFIDSELGLIPKGWQVRPIGDVVECVGGGTPSTKEPAYWEGGTHNWASPKDLSGADSPILLDTAGKLTDSGLGKVSSGLLSAGTVLMSSRAPIGYLAITGMPTAINQGFIAMKASGPLPNSYLYLWAQANMEEIKSRANGSTFMEISKAAFRPIPTVIPSQSVIDAFHQLASPMFSRIESGARAAENLSDIRDLLLPRLLSGRGCVSSAIDQAVAD